MKELNMDASSWKDREGLYLSFFKAVDAPEWHGKNFNALRDSIAVGDINGIEVPYCIVITNFASVPASLKQDAQDFIDLINELEKEGVPVRIRVEL